MFCISSSLKHNFYVYAFCLSIELLVMSLVFMFLPQFCATVLETSNDACFS